MEGFPLLQDYAEDRIRFFVGQAAILTSTWGSLRRDPPKYITVLVSDGPGDLQKRAYLAPRDGLAGSLGRGLPQLEPSRRR